MFRYMSYVVDGLSMGLLYGLLAMGLVLIYRATRVVNFAQGELALLTTYLSWSLLSHMPAWVAVSITLVVAFFLGVAVEFGIMRRVDEGHELNAIIVTIGLFTVVNSIVLWKYGSIPQAYPSPFGEGVWNAFGVAISHRALGTMAVGLLAVVLLFVFFQHTRVGLAMRATAQSWYAARTIGIRIERMWSLGWALSTVLGLVAGMLAAPKLFLHPSMMQSMLVYAVAAAVVGGLESPGGAIVGGLVVGVIESLAGSWERIGGDLKTVTAVGVLVLILVVRPTGLFGRPTPRKV